MKKILLLLIAFLTFTISGSLVPEPAYAACTSTDKNKQDVLIGVGQAGGDCDGSGVDDFVEAIVKILSWLVGIIALIMIIVSGFKYIVSGGDSGKITSAKNTLIYALIGLAIAVLAQVLINFAYTTSNQVANPPPPKSSKP